MLHEQLTKTRAYTHSPVHEKITIVRNNYLGLNLLSSDPSNPDTSLSGSNCMGPKQNLNYLIIRKIKIRTNLLHYPGTQNPDKFIWLSVASNSGQI